MHRTYTKRELADAQLDRAIELFLDEEDYLSAITLAAAAEELYGGLFVKDAAASDPTTQVDTRRSHEHDLDAMEKIADKFGHTYDRKDAVSTINYARDALKHFGAGGDPVFFDAADEAADMIDRAMGNLRRLTGNYHQRVGEFDSVRSTHMAERQRYIEALDSEPTATPYDAKRKSEARAQADVTKRREIIMYSELWHASGCLFAAGLRKRRGSSWQFLASATLTAFTFEAYLNHVGSRVIACWAELDRCPVWAKFEVVCETLKVIFPEGRGARPLQTVAELLRFRDRMAHGRSESIEPLPEVHDVSEHLDRKLGERPLARWEGLIQAPDFAQLAREDVAKVLGAIHAACPEPKEGLFAFGIGTHSASLRGESA